MKQVTEWVIESLTHPICSKTLNHLVTLLLGDGSCSAMALE